MRVVLTAEGRQHTPRLMLLPGSLSWEEATPVVRYKERWALSNVLGLATDIRREENGDITAEIPDHLVPEGEIVAVYCTDIVEMVMSINPRIIVKARLREISFRSPTEKI